MYEVVPTREKEYKTLIVDLKVLPHAGSTLRNKDNDKASTERGYTAW